MGQRIAPTAPTAVWVKRNGSATMQAVEALRDAAETPSDWAMPSLADDQRPPGVRERDARRAAAWPHGAACSAASSGTAASRPGRRAAAPPEQVPQQAIRAAAPVMSERRELLQIVTRRKDDQAMRWELDESLPLMQLSLQSDYTLCEACFRVCPTGAIEIVENPGDWALTFQADRCVGCQVCLEACQPRVLDADASFDVQPGQPPITLISRNKQRCARCDRHFASASPRRPARCAGTTKTPSPPSSADRRREHDTMEWDFTTEDVVKGHADYTLQDFRSGLAAEVRSNLGPMDEAQLTRAFNLVYDLCYALATDKDIGEFMSLRLRPADLRVPRRDQPHASDNAAMLGAILQRLIVERVEADMPGAGGGRCARWHTRWSTSLPELGQ
jgi:ferredoxin